MQEQFEQELQRYREEADMHKERVRAQSMELERTIADKQEADDIEAFKDAAQKELELVILSFHSEMNERDRVEERLREEVEEVRQEIKEMKKKVERFEREREEEKEKVKEKEEEWAKEKEERLKFIQEIKAENADL